MAGASSRTSAHRFSVSATAVFRHRAEHLAASLVTAREAQQAANADDVLGEVRTRTARAVTILGQADADGDVRSAVAAIRAARGCIELLAGLLHALDRRPTVTLLVLPAWVTVRSARLSALAPSPEARQAVAAQVAALGEAPA